MTIKEEMAMDEKGYNQVEDEVIHPDEEKGEEE